MSSVQLMYERASRKFGLPYDSNNAQQSFVDAVNFALSELADIAFWTEQSINSISDVLNLTTSNERVLSMGINYYLSDMGYKPTSEETNMFAKWRDSLRTAQMLTQQEQ